MLQALRVLLILNILCVCTCATGSCEKPKWFKCKNDKCIYFTLVCDGEDDCDDNSDEMDCIGFTLAPPTNCPKDEFQCLDKICVPKDLVCDGKKDCLDGSDETIDCIDTKLCDDFRCPNGFCIPNQWVCDGTNDCEDNSDELNCSSNYLNASARACSNSFNSYLCKNEKCIALNKVCDNKDDCGDNSDENTVGCANAEMLCSKNKLECSHLCSRTPNGPMCSCPSGYNLLNNRTCLDIDECKMYGKCDQRCENLEGSFKCTCQDGYELQKDQRTCKASGGEAVLILSMKTEIREYYLNTMHYIPIVRDLQHVVGVSRDSDYIYWSNVQLGDEAIVKQLEFGSKPEVIVTTGLGSPEDIAVDWVTGNVYFTDSILKRIGVCTNNGSSCTVIISESTDKPRGIVLLPSAGQMFWSDWGTNAHISKAGMDGKDNVPFITENIQWPNGLAIDYPNERLYWVDGKLNIIESIGLNGNDRRTVLQKVVKRPYSIAIFENKLYWSDWKTNSVQSCDKFSGKNQKTLIHGEKIVYGVHIYHSVLTPKIPNSCEHGFCSHICLLAVNKTYSCACPLDMELGSDQHTCKAIMKQKHIVIGAGNMFIDYYQEILGKPKMTGSLSIRHIMDLAYDSLSGTVFGSDRLTNSIFRFDPKTGRTATLVSVKNESIEGIDFDYLGNNLYWCNKYRKTIEIYSLNTKERSVLQFTETPGDVILVPNYGIMFVAFHSKNKVHIDKLQMTGLGPRTRIVENNILGPKVTFAYDREFEKIYWADESTGRIESTSVEGKDRRLFRTGLYGLVSLAVLDREVFWTTRRSKRLYWANKNNIIEGIKTIRLEVANDLEMMHLVTLSGIYAGAEHKCSQNNAGCSHVCLVVTSKLHMCSCPPGLSLNSDKRTCNMQTTCRSDEIRCTADNICIDEHKRCDKTENCSDGEDEANCEQIVSCSNAEFTCKNGQCVNSSKRCDYAYDCKDRSDEDDCNTKICKPYEFQCRQGDCISKYLVCNDHSDCIDSSDEDNCGEHTCDLDSFLCKSGACIPKHWKCDGDIDCTDGSDEDERCKSNTCSDNMFICHNGHCIDMLLTCNSVDDCGDNSDERECLEKTKIDYVPCKENEYQCYGTNTCVPQSSRCDGIKDCPRNDDENHCAECEQNQFTCDNLKCIQQSWVCDEVDDCGDKSDERNCNADHHQVTINNTDSIHCKEYKCTTGTCLPYSSVCNGKPDCFDNSDEGGQCESSCNEVDPCEMICLRTPSGPVCTCPKGYRLHKDGHSCEDINECDDSVCSQICHNQPGSFSCSCFDGYVLRGDMVSCKVDGPPMEIIAIVKDDIRKISPSLNSLEVIHRQSNVDVIGLDVNAKYNTIYWSSELTGMIYKMSLKMKTMKMINVGKPHVLAVDWVTDNVYVYDIEHLSTIKVCNLERENCAKIVSIEETVNVMAIAVDPIHGWLFWSQTSWSIFNNPTSEIYRTDMIGSNLTVIAFQSVGAVSGITVDYMRSHLYWADIRRQVIERSDLNGANRQVFLRAQVYQPIGLNLYEDSLYWLMGNTGKLRSCSLYHTLYDNKICHMIDISSTHVDKFVILQISRQPFVKNDCQDHKCDYMCALRNGKSICICPNGYTIEANVTCSEDSNRKIELNSSTSEIKHTRGSGALTGIIITAVTAVVIISAYCYYQKKKLGTFDEHDLSIRFQNPSYNRRREFTNVEPVLPPGEHAYANPLVDLPKSHGQEVKNVQKIIELIPSDNSESEVEDAIYSQKSRLLPRI